MHSCAQYLPQNFGLHYVMYIIDQTICRSQRRTVDGVCIISGFGYFVTRFVANVQKNKQTITTNNDYIEVYIIHECVCESTQCII